MKNTLLDDPFRSYSFSLPLTLCNDIKYFKKTTPGNSLNADVDRFVLDLIINNKKPSIPLKKVPRGRRSNSISFKKTKDDKYIPCPFSLRRSTTEKIKEYKGNGNKHDLDRNVEEYIKLRVPYRE